MHVLLCAHGAAAVFVMGCKASYVASCAQQIAAVDTLRYKQTTRGGKGKQNRRRLQATQGVASADKSCPEVMSRASSSGACKVAVQLSHSSGAC